MNPKIAKLEKEITKKREKVAEWQASIRDLERQKTELENTEYVAIIRSMNMTPQQLAEFMKGNAPPMPASTAPDFRPDDDAADFAPEQEDAEDEE